LSQYCLTTTPTSQLKASNEIMTLGYFFWGGCGAGTHGSHRGIHGTYAHGTHTHGTPIVLQVLVHLTQSTSPRESVSSTNHTRVNRVSNPIAIFSPESSLVTRENKQK